MDFPPTGWYVFCAIAYVLIGLLDVFLRLNRNRPSPSDPKRPESLSKESKESI